MYRDYEGVGSDVVDCSFKIHMHLGPGLLESAYKALLARELARRGHVVEIERPVALEYQGYRIEGAFRADLLVARCVVVEVKSVERLAPVFSKQVLTYLRLLDLRLGYLINFGESLLRDGLHRIVNQRASCR